MVNRQYTIVNRKWIPACHPTCSTIVENPLQIAPIMQNKPNFQNAQMNVSIFSQMAYEYKHNWTLSENEPKTNPNKPNQTQSQDAEIWSHYDAGPGRALTIKLLTSHERRATKQWRRGESNPHFRDATAVCSRYTTSPKLSK